MATFPPINQIVGNHGQVYEAYFKQADPNGTGSVGALDAATFMKKSGLKDQVLSQIWDLSDPGGRGYLEKPGFFVALKLISIAQNGQEVNISKLTSESPQPNLGPVETVAETVPTQATGPWALSAGEKSKYDKVFDSLLPVSGLLAGEKVRPVLMNSKLPVDVLGKIWDLSDIDKDGFLDRDEFAVAMHLVHKGMAKETIPATLPPNLIPPSKRKPLPGAVPVLPGVALGGPGSGRSTPVMRSDSPALKAPVWVVSATDKANYDVMFRKADLDMDGFVSGQEIRDIFLQSGLQNNVLAHIWNLCDTKSMGKLNSEQFALAIFLVQQKLKGIDPPPQLTPEMIPPSVRPKTGTADPTAFGVADGGTSAGPYGHVADFSALKELDMIQKEIDEIKKQKLQHQADQQQRQADIRICQGEVQTLQKELDAVTATLHQLESQKKDAQKALDDLDDKKSKLETSAREMKQKCEDEQKQIDELNSQLQKQARSALNQEEELSTLRDQLTKLREEENQLEQKVDTGKQQLEQFSKTQRDLQLQVSQTRTRIQHLQDQHRAIQQGTAAFSSFNSDDTKSLEVSSIPDDQFSSRATQGSPGSTISSISLGSLAEDFKDDPFKNKDPFGEGGGAQADPFAGEDPFKSSDPFKSEGFTSDPFASEDPFKNAFGSSGTASKQEDPFSSSDPFGSAFSSSSSSSNKKLDAFDPFGASGSTPSKQKLGGDLFGSDPFAPSSSSSTRSHSESPRPSLPPKQKKAPPPRPAPPRSPMKSPAKQPNKPDPFGGFGSDPFASSDPFGSSGVSSGGAGGDAFANFADFSPSKVSVSKCMPNELGQSIEANKNSSGMSEGELAWAFSESKTTTSSTSASASIGDTSLSFNSSSSTMSKKQQEDADFKFALALSRGEIADSQA